MGPGSAHPTSNRPCSVQEPGAGQGGQRPELVAVVEPVTLSLGAIVSAAVVKAVPALAAVLRASEIKLPVVPSPLRALAAEKEARLRGSAEAPAAEGERERRAQGGLRSGVWSASDPHRHSPTVEPETDLSLTAFTAEAAVEVPPAAFAFAALLLLKKALVPAPVPNVIP